MLTLLQKADTLSVSQQGTSILTDVSPAHAGQTGDLRLLLQCVELLQQLLGQDVVNLFVHLCAHPPANASLHSIGCAYTEVLFTGPQLGGLPDQPQAADTRDALRSWRRQRSAAILQLGHLISQMSQGTPMPALRDYITHIAPAAPSANAMSTQSAAQLATSAGHALTIMLRQFATQQLQSASFMLLLTWFDSLRAAGALHITAAVSNALKQEIAPQLRAHIRSTSITLWLCTAPAAAVAGDETARLKHSELSSKLASLDFVSGGRQQAHHQQCLAELFLPDFAAHCGGETMPLSVCLPLSPVQSVHQSGGQTVQVSIMYAHAACGMLAPAVAHACDTSQETHKLCILECYAKQLLLLFLWLPAVSVVRCLSSHTPCELTLLHFFAKRLLLHYALSAWVA